MVEFTEIGNTSRRAVLQEVRNNLVWVLLRIRHLWAVTWGCPAKSQEIGQAVRVTNFFLFA